MAHGRKLDEFVAAYVRCALWSSSDESTPDGGAPLDQNYAAEDFATDTIDAMIADCDKFRAELGSELMKVIGARPRHHSGVYTVEDAGHDFWLSRNGHGAGFFDQKPDVERDAAWDRLQGAAERFGNFDLYVGVDGTIDHG